MARFERSPAWLAVSLLWLSMSGCSSFFASPAELPVAPVDRHLTLTLDASLDTNRNLFGRPSPVRVRVFQLADSGAFGQATELQLSDSAEQILAKDLLRQEVFLLRPGERYCYHFIPEPRMRHLGVVAEYRDIDDARWRVVARVDHSETPQMFVLIGRHAVEFTPPILIEHIHD